MESNALVLNDEQWRGSIDGIVFKFSICFRYRHRRFSWFSDRTGVITGTESSTLVAFRYMDAAVNGTVVISGYIRQWILVVKTSHFFVVNVVGARHFLIVKIEIGWINSGVLELSWAVDTH